MARKSRSPESVAASPDEGAQADTFLAHVGRVMARRPEAREPGRSDWVIARRGPGPALSAAPGEGVTPAVRHRLVCGRCGWGVDCLSADAARFAAAGCQLCALVPAESPVPAATGGHEAEPGRPGRGPGDRRRRRRRAPTWDVWVAVRRADDPEQADLALALADVCGEGLGVWLKAPVRAGEGVTVAIARRRGRPVTAEADVRWCAPDGGVTYRAGLRLRRGLTRAELAELTM